MSAPWSLAVKPPPCCGVTVKKEREELCCHLLGALLDTSFGQSRLTWRCRLLKRGDGHRRFPAIATMECCCCRGGEPIICCFAGVECCLAGALEVPLVAVPPRRGRDIVKPWNIVVPPLLLSPPSSPSCLATVAVKTESATASKVHRWTGMATTVEITSFTLGAGSHRGRSRCFEVFPTRCRS